MISAEEYIKGYKEYIKNSKNDIEQTMLENLKNIFNKNEYKNKTINIIDNNSEEFYRILEDSEKYLTAVNVAKEILNKYGYKLVITSQKDMFGDDNWYCFRFKIKSEY